MNKKRIIIIVVAVVVFLIAGGTAVYANYYHKEKIKLEEQERLEIFRQEVDEELVLLEKKVLAFYADETKDLLADGILLDDIESTASEAEALLKKYSDDPDVTEEQLGRMETLKADMEVVGSMKAALDAYEGLYQDGVLAAPSDAATDALTSLKAQLEELKDTKPDFYSQYTEKIAEAEAGLKAQEDAAASVYMIYDKATGLMVEGTTREQYTVVMTVLEGLPENALKAELKQYLSVVDQALTTQETEAKESAYEEEQKASSGSKNSSSGSNNSQNSTSSGSSAGTSSGSSGGGSSNSSGSSGTSNSGSSSSGFSNSSSSGSSGSENSSSDSNNSGSGSDSSGTQSWEGTITGGGDIKGGGTWESFTW